MGQVLRERLKQDSFASPRHEATMNLMLAANWVRQVVDRACSEFDITNQQYNILRILRGVSPEGHRCADIRDRMLDRSPDITRRLDTLEKMGLVRRQRSKEDRRAVLSYITPKGLELLEKMDPTIARINEEFGERLTMKECRALSDLCERIYAE